MTLVKHELKQSKLSFLIWTLSIGFMIALCVFLYPEMSSQMEDVTDIFASMGSFTAAFGMDRLNFGTLIGFYAVECGNILSLGGAFYAAFCAVAVLSKEEKEKTTEFLLTHPVSRKRIVTEKLISVIILITAMNIIVYALAVGSFAAIDETVPMKEMNLLHIAYYLMQIEIAGICFCISAFVRKGSIGIGLGMATILYFLNLVANITESAEFLKYITPFGYCEAADIIADGSLDITLIAIGMAVTLCGIARAYIKYTKKDIH